MSRAVYWISDTEIETLQGVGLDAGGLRFLAAASGYFPATTPAGKGLPIKASYTRNAQFVIEALPTPARTTS